MTRREQQISKYIEERKCFRRILVRHLDRREENYLDFGTTHTILHLFSIYIQLTWCLKEEYENLTKISKGSFIN